MIFGTWAPFGARRDKNFTNLSQPKIFLCVTQNIFIRQLELKYVEYSLQLKSRKPLLIYIQNDKIIAKLCKFYDRPEKQVDFYLIATFCWFKYVNHRES